MALKGKSFADLPQYLACIDLRCWLDDNSLTIYFWASFLLFVFYLNLWPLAGSSSHWALEWWQSGATAFISQEINRFCQHRREAPNIFWRVMFQLTKVEKITQNIWKKTEINVQKKLRVDWLLNVLSSSELSPSDDSETSIHSVLFPL